MKVFIVSNSGSSSERLSLYEGENEVCSLYFEGIEEGGKKQFICTAMRADGSEEVLEKKWGSLDVAFEEAKLFFEKEGFISDKRPLDGVLVRVVAAGKYFSQHHIVDGQTLEELDKVRITNPLHVSGTERGIKNARKAFKGVPVVIMSDSEALMKDSRKDAKYALPQSVLKIFDFARWGAHGASYGYMMDRIQELGLLEDKMVVCHLGSGCSVTALKGGEPVYTSMGETPLEGLMSSTRTGSIDPTIGAILGEKFGAAKAIKLMNKESGLLAMAGSDDMREIIAAAEEGDSRAATAYDMFVDGVVGKIGEFAAKMGGLDAIVFTATIGERSIPVRSSIISKLEFMGFKIKSDAWIDKSKGYTDVAADDSKPIYIIPANEAAYMIKKASELLDTR